MMNYLNFRNITVFLAVIAVVVLSYFYVDKDLALYFKALSGPVKTFFKEITDLGKSEWYIVPSLILFFVFKKYGKLLYARYALFILTTNVVAGIGVWLLKYPFGRYRPRMLFEENLYGFSGFGYKYGVVSFPSGHSITIMATVMAFALLFPRYAVPLLFSGAVIAFSRVATTHHYFGDVVMGSYLGIICSIILYHKMVKDYKVA